MLLTSALAAAASIALGPTGRDGSLASPTKPPKLDGGPSYPTGDAQNPAAAEDPVAGPAVDRHALDALQDFDQIAPGVWRIEGPLDIKVEAGERAGVTTYAFDDRMLVDTKLPVGYPQPTPPDAIEIKAYPGVRRAEISGAGSPDLGMNLAFWPLFQHIDRSGIAMTAPVEIDYRGLQMDRLDAAPRPDGWTMSFLYEKDSDGPEGEFGRVEVIDREPMMVLAAGVRGAYRYSRMQAAMARLAEWLEANPGWEAAGEPRMLGYNGPDRRPADQWSEIQIPIRLVPPDAANSIRSQTDAQTVETPLSPSR